MFIFVFYVVWYCEYCWELIETWLLWGSHRLQWDALCGKFNLFAILCSLSNKICNIMNIKLVWKDNDDLMVPKKLSSRHYGVGHLMFQKCPHMLKLIFVHFIISFRYYFEGSSLGHMRFMLYIFRSSFLFFVILIGDVILYSIFVLSVILVCCMLSLHFLIYPGAQICPFSAISSVE
jgi:hypothetical protein